MKIQFYKYQGTGNDFIIIDDRREVLKNPSKDLVSFLCDRRFGIGADGLILMQEHETFDFMMVYYNSDGNESSMCGNGGRCIVKFAHDLGLISSSTRFIAIDGPHDAHVLENENVALKMIDVPEVEKGEDYYFLNTGSPHFVKFLNQGIQEFDLIQNAQNIRYNDRFKEKGTNVNFAQINDEKVLEVRTYERGVEGETLSCGTGVTASALVYNFDQGDLEQFVQEIKTPGGDLKVRFDKKENAYSNIWLEGPAKFVFKGEIAI